MFVCFFSSTISNMQNTSKRKRVKKLLKILQEQVEFYFSDANLNRDNFMKTLVGENGNEYVSLNILLEFNHLKQFKANIRLLQRALVDSDHLQLSDDKTKVKRKAQNILPLSADSDIRTIFVDCLPDNATVFWLKEICKKFGNMNYISLPRFKSGLLKGFAFIEFSDHETAELACSVINSPPENFFPKLILQTYKPILDVVQVTNEIQDNGENIAEPFSENNKSVSNSGYQIQIKNLQLKYSMENSSSPSMLQTKKKENCLAEGNMLLTNDISQSDYKYNFLNTNTQTCNNLVQQEDNVDFKPTVKSKITLAQTPRKRISDVSMSKYLKVEQPCTKKIKLLALDKNCTTEQNSFQLDAKMITIKKKKIRRRPRKTRNKIKLGNITVNVIKLKAMMKTEWLELKKAYVREQRENFGKLKSILQKSTSPDPDTTSVYIKHHLALKKSAAETYRDASDDDADAAEQLSVTSEGTETNQVFSTPTYVAGVIASISSLHVKCSITKELSPLPNFKFIKSHFSRYGEVAYVDVNEGASHGFIRFKTSEVAQRAILEDKQFGLCLLTGVNEEKYWDNLLISRQLKRTRERVRTSGKQKLIMRAENKTKAASTRHIKFNENFQ